MFRSGLGPTQTWLGPTQTWPEIGAYFASNGPLHSPQTSFAVILRDAELGQWASPVPVQMWQG